MNKYSAKRNNLKWVGVDLDLTLAKKCWPKPGIGDPYQRASASLKTLRQDGYKIVIYTARAWGDYENIENWLNDHQIPFDKIICGKLLLKMYIGDENFRATGDWETDLPQIRALLSK